MSKWKPPPPALLSLNCAGPFSDPEHAGPLAFTPETCTNTVPVLMPVNLDSLTQQLRTAGWFVSVVTPPGVNPPEVTTLCGDCARALVPDLVEATLKVWAEGKGAGQEKGS